jgi:hypothetical protein
MISHSAQSSLDKFMVEGVATPAWTHEGLLAHIVKLIVANDKVSYDDHSHSRLSTYRVFKSILLVKKDAFHALLKFQQPQMLS